MAHISIENSNGQIGVLRVEIDPGDFHEVELQELLSILSREVHLWAVRQGLGWWEETCRLCGRSESHALHNTVISDKPDHSFVAR